MFYDATSGRYRRLLDLAAFMKRFAQPNCRTRTVERHGGTDGAPVVRPMALIEYPSGAAIPWTACALNKAYYFDPEAAAAVPPPLERRCVDDHRHLGVDVTAADIPSIEEPLYFLAETTSSATYGDSQKYPTAHRGASNPAAAQALSWCGKLERSRRQRLVLERLCATDFVGFRHVPGGRGGGVQNRGGGTQAVGVASFLPDNITLHVFPVHAAVGASSPSSLLSHESVVFALGPDRYARSICYRMPTRPAAVAAPMSSFGSSRRGGEGGDFDESGEENSAAVDMHAQLRLPANEPIIGITADDIVGAIVCVTPSSCIFCPSGGVVVNPTEEGSPQDVGASSLRVRIRHGDDDDDASGKRRFATPILSHDGNTVGVLSQHIVVINWMSATLTAPAVGRPPAVVAVTARWRMPGRTRCTALGWMLAGPTNDHRVVVAGLSDGRVALLDERCSRLTAAWSAHPNSNVLHLEELPLSPFHVVSQSSSGEIGLWDVRQVSSSASAMEAAPVHDAAWRLGSPHHDPSSSHHLRRSPALVEVLAAPTRISCAAPHHGRRFAIFRPGTVLASAPVIAFVDAATSSSAADAIRGIGAGSVATTPLRIAVGPLFATAPPSGRSLELPGVVTSLAAGEWCRRPALVTAAAYAIHPQHDELAGGRVSAIDVASVVQAHWFDGVMPAGGSY